MLSVVFIGFANLMLLNTQWIIDSPSSFNHILLNDVYVLGNMLIETLMHIEEI